MLGTNNTVNEPSKMVLDRLLNLNKFIEHTLPESNVAISNLITGNEHLHCLQMDVIDNGNLTSNELNKGELHVNLGGLGKPAVNFIRRIKKIITACQVDRSFHKPSSLILR